MYSVLNYVLAEGAGQLIVSLLIAVLMIAST